MNGLLRRAYTIWRQKGLKRLAHRARYYRYKRIPPFTFRMKLRWLKNRVMYGWYSVPHPLRKLYIDPDLIKYTGPHFDKAKHIGTIKQGKWDEKNHYLKSIARTKVYLNELVNKKTGKKQFIFNVLKKRSNLAVWPVGVRQFPN